MKPYREMSKEELASLKEQLGCVQRVSGKKFKPEYGTWQAM